jgi:hypothetical protein
MLAWARWQSKADCHADIKSIGVYGGVVATDSSRGGNWRFVCDADTQGA